MSTNLIIPASRPKLAEAKLFDLLESFPTLKLAEPVFMVGIRGFFGSSNRRGVYDDALFVVSQNGYFCYNWNMDPGLHGYNPNAEKGYATLAPNRVHRWRQGIHRGRYRAFVQAERFTVIRDAYTLGGRHFASITETGWFGINGHAGNVNGTSSEGCQTAPGPQFYEMRDLTFSIMDRHNRADIQYLPIDRDKL